MDGRGRRSRIIREVALGCYPLRAAQGFAALERTLYEGPARDDSWQTEQLGMEIAAMRSWDPIRLPPPGADLGVETNLVWVRGGLDEEVLGRTLYEMAWGGSLLTVTFPVLFMRPALVDAYNKARGVDLDLWLRLRGIPSTMGSEFGCVLRCRDIFDPRDLKHLAEHPVGADKLFHGRLHPVSAVLMRVGGANMVAVPLVPSDVSAEAVRLREWGFVFSTRKGE